MLKTKKVIYIVWNENPGGLEKVLTYYPANLNKYDTRLFVLRPNKRSVEIFPEGMFTQKIYGSNNNIRLYFKLFRFALKNQRSIYHLLNAGPLVLLFLKLAGCKKILYHIHGTIYWKKKLLKTPTRLIWKLALSKNVKLVANSAFSKKMFLERANGHYAVNVIYNPFDLPDNKTKEGVINDDTMSIFYVGRLAQGKNLFQWIEIAGQLVNELPEASFHWYGKGQLEEELKNYVDKKGIEKRFFFHGYLKDISQAYAKHDLLLFLSEYESFGNVVVESILQGTPVLAKPIPSIQEIFADYPEFLLNEEEDYATQVISKLKRYSDLKKVARQAQKDFEVRFSLENHLGKITELYEKL